LCVIGELLRRNNSLEDKVHLFNQQMSQQNKNLEQLQELTNMLQESHRLDEKKLSKKNPTCLLLCTYWLSGRAWQKKYLAQGHGRTDLTCTEWDKNICPGKNRKKTAPKQVHMPFEPAGRRFTAHSPKPVQTPSRDFSVWFLIGAREWGCTVIW
jgi:hypothetical protein